MTSFATLSSVDAIRRRVVDADEDETGANPYVDRLQVEIKSTSVVNMFIVFDFQSEYRMFVEK